MDTDNASVSEGQQGMTLIEVVIAMVILSLAVVAVVGGMTVLAASSYAAHQRADVGTTLRSAIENLESSPYVPCTSTNPTMLSGYATDLDSTTLTSYDGSPDVAAPTVVAATATGVGGTSLVGCTSDPGIQAIEVTVVSSDKKISETLWVVKRNPS